MNCPICHAKNVTAAHVLGHGGKGKAKTLTEAERQRRRELMDALNAARSLKNISPQGDITTTTP